MRWLFFIFFIANITYFGYFNYFLKANEQNISVKKATVDNQIQLLSEVDSGQLKKLSVDDNQMLTKEINEVIAVAAPIDRSNNVSSRQCFKLGPIDKKSMDEMRLILEKIYVNNISFEITATSPITYHRIYIPPQKDRATINNILVKLDENDLTDHYVMSVDGRKNAIALGVFKKRKTAEEIATKVNYLGYSTAIESITKDKNSLYNILFEFTDNQDLYFFDKFLVQNNLKYSACENND